MRAAECHSVTLLTSLPSQEASHRRIEFRQGLVAQTHHRIMAERDAILSSADQEIVEAARRDARQNEGVDKARHDKDNVASLAQRTGSLLRHPHS